jgi:uncharacterized protein YjiK
MVVLWKIIGSQSQKKYIKNIAKHNSGKHADTTPRKRKESNSLSGVTIVRKWDMPAELKEISALSNIDDHRFACVQDEMGTIYVYNIAQKIIEKKIQFSHKGDFEGVAFTGSHYYVVRADGQLFETPLSETEKNNTRQYKTSLTVKHNVEGLCYDKENNRLLLATKDELPHQPGFKGIYAFDLEKKALIDDPVYKIDMQHNLFTQSKKSKVMPSAITIHPESKEIFITDGPQSRLLIMDSSGQPKQFLELGKDFSQPEGITFDSYGNLYISNEGTKEPGNILQVRL